jgi:hypothetical protein
MTFVTLTIPPRQFSSTFAVIFIAVFLLRNSQARVLDFFDVFSSKKSKRAFIPEKTGRFVRFCPSGRKNAIFQKNTRAIMHILTARSQYAQDFSKENMR